MAELTEMKFYVAKNLRVAAGEFMMNNDFGLFAKTTQFWLGAETRVTLMSSKGCDPENKRKELCDKLTEVFKDKTLKWSVSLTTQRVRNTSPTYHYPQTECRISLDMEVDVVEGLKSVLGNKQVALQAMLYDLEYFNRRNREPYNFNLVQSIKTQEIPFPTTQTNKDNIIFVDTNYNEDICKLLNYDLRNCACPNRMITAALDLILVVKTSDTETKFFGGPPTMEKLAINKKILELEILPDAVIVAGDGSEVKCHRSFLAAHCPELYAMFTTDMREANTGRVEMLDMSEKGVRAFLPYLYHWDLSKAVESCAVALELLHAGHKYNIRLLEKDIRKLLLSKEDAWYSVDVAIDLFLFVENLDAAWNSLKDKAIKVLKGNPTQLKHSETYQELFRKNPDAAMRLFEYSLSSSV